MKTHLKPYFVSAGIVFGILGLVSLFLSFLKLLKAGPFECLGWDIVLDPIWWPLVALCVLITLILFFFLASLFWAVIRGVFTTVKP